MKALFDAFAANVVPACLSRPLPSASSCPSPDESQKYEYLNRVTLRKVAVTLLFVKNGQRDSTWQGMAKPSTAGSSSKASVQCILQILQFTRKKRPSFKKIFNNVKEKSFKRDHPSFRGTISTSAGGRARGLTQSLGSGLSQMQRGKKETWLQLTGDQTLQSTKYVDNYSMYLQSLLVVHFKTDPKDWASQASSTQDIWTSDCSIKISTFFLGPCHICHLRWNWNVTF